MNLARQFPFSQEQNPSLYAQSAEPGLQRQILLPENAI
jgi:hypothetical protein